MGVHYPQPQDDTTPDRNFHDGVKKFVAKEHPLIIIGDFNTPKEIGTVTIDGYKDLLPANEPTSAFGTKLDYIFLNESHSGGEVELIKTAVVISYLGVIN